MMDTFKKEKQELKLLNKKYEKYWETEFCDRDYSDVIANYDNFDENVFYHQTNSEEDRKSILENGFDPEMVLESNRGVGKGLYLGRDRQALIHFYNEDVGSNKDYTIKIIGEFIFFDTIKNENFDFVQKNIEQNLLEKGYDGIRYFDPDATGEEYVLYNLDKIKSIT